MSVFKKFNRFIDDHWIDSIFTIFDIQEYFNYEQNEYICALKYLEYYINAGFIQRNYIIDSIDSGVEFKVLGHIPYSFKLTITELKKLSDSKYKERYIRKAKLNLLEFKTKY